MVIKYQYSNSKGYFYNVVSNAQGDIIELRNGAGAVTAKYTYDSWGKLVSITDASGNAVSPGNIGVLNSIRYRGYVYDTETGLYYLQSRYYDPEVGRFINCDDVNYIGVSDTVVSYNPFAYCENNPVNGWDPNGTFINAIIGSVFGAAYGALEAKISKSNPKIGAISGAVSGFISGLGIDIAVTSGPFGGVIASAISGSLASVISKLITYYLNHNFTIKKLKQKSVIKELAYSALLGALFNVIGYSWTKSLNMGNPPSEFSRLKKILYSLNFRINDVQNSAFATAALAYILGIRQSVINSILERIKK